MLGSEIIDINPRMAGLDLGVPEVRMFGYVRFREAIRTSDDWSSHTGPELIYVISGEACWEHADEQLIQAAGGQLILFPKGTRHRISHSVYPPSESFWLIMKEPGDIEKPSLLTPEAHVELSSLLNSGCCICDGSEETLNQVLAISRMLVDPIVFSGGGLTISELRARLLSVLLEFWKCIAGRRFKRDASPMVQEAKKFIHENARQAIRIEDVAEVVGLTRGYLHARFRKEMGMSPIDYLQRLRIKWCCEQLSNSSDSITEVALENGFESSQYFSRVFRKYLGLTPSEFRNRLKERVG
jgi:AraC-like DNA-binding protein